MKNNARHVFNNYNLLKMIKKKKKTNVSLFLSLFLYDLSILVALLITLFFLLYISRFVNIDI